MESLTQREEKRGVNKLLILGLVIGAALVALVLWLLSMRPAADEQMANLLEAAYHENSAEFAELSKDIIISTDDKTVESPTAFGTISMYINGKIRNKGTRTIDILEVNVAVVTQFSQVLKEKRILVVPVQQPTLEPGQIIPITLTLDGFAKDDDRANIRWKVTAIRAR
jgi:hypothetical protein